MLIILLLVLYDNHSVEIYCEVDAEEYQVGTQEQIASTATPDTTTMQ